EALLDHFEKEKWGAKAHNYFRIRSALLEKDKMSFELQYRTSADGPWITYQKIRGLLPRSSDSTDPDFKGLSDGSETNNQDHPFGEDELVRASHHSEASPLDETVCYYGWRDASVGSYGINLSKIDPRTMRFGLN